MSEENCTRRGCKDVFHAFLVQNAEFDGKLEIPCIAPEKFVPHKLIPFSKALSGEKKDCWVHFYEDDVKFERIWNRPGTYLAMLKRYQGVISPDFSLYRDMPLVMQQWNTYRGRAIGHWLQENGVPVIPNIRFGDERTFEFCCAGVEKGSTIAIGSHSCMKLLKEREYFKQGLDFVMDRLKPGTVIIYGSAPDEIFSPYKQQGIEILQFDSETALAHKAVSV